MKRLEKKLAKMLQTQFFISNELKGVNSNSLM